MFKFREVGDNEFAAQKQSTVSWISEFGVQPSEPRFCFKSGFSGLNPYLFLNLGSAG